MISYSYTPEDWSQERFMALGGFTVVFLNYNKAAFIERSVKSALEQDFPCCEMFFMDDASTDGSGETMERLVREYRGRHKVTVVRNHENHYITGQWNLAAKLANGNWLGMFCGDDIAHVDRISVAAKVILSHPSLRGYSSAAVDIDARTGFPLPESHYVPTTYVANGTAPAESLADNFRSNGSTSFWHISLFRKPLPRVPLDDDFLHLRLYAMNRSVASPVYFYDVDHKTIDYSVGVGITASNGRYCEVSNESIFTRWCRNVMRHKDLSHSAARTISAALEESKSFGVDDLFFRAFTKVVLLRRIAAGNTFTRIALLPKVCMCLLDTRFSLRFKRPLIKLFLHDFILEFFGLRVASFFSFLRHNTGCAVKVI